uniref:Gastrula zinc finger n=1 Tax=Triatoma infestans TaxID=30076 RepID=A0A161M6S7_TRIIF
MQSRINVVIVI